MFNLPLIVTPPFSYMLQIRFSINFRKLPVKHPEGYSILVKWNLQAYDCNKNYICYGNFCLDFSDTAIERNVYEGLSLLLRRKCPYSELFWSVLSRIWTEQREMRSISIYSVRMRENADQNNSEYGHFSRSVYIYCPLETARKIKFFIKDFSSKYDQIRRKLRIWSHILEKSLMENFIFCAVRVSEGSITVFMVTLTKC